MHNLRSSCQTVDCALLHGIIGLHELAPASLLQVEPYLIITQNSDRQCIQNDSIHAYEEILSNFHPYKIYLIFIIFLY